MLRQFNFEFQVILGIFWFELRYCGFGKLKLERETSFFAHCFVLQVELRILDFVQRLFLSFALKESWQQIVQNIFNGFLLCFSTAIQSVLMHFQFGASFHFALFCSFTERSGNVWVVGVGVLPELAHKSMPLFLSLLWTPVLVDNQLEHRQTHALLQFCRSKFLEFVHKNAGFVVFENEKDFLEAIHCAFEIDWPQELLLALSNGHAIA